MDANFREVSYSADLDCVELPPPEVGCKQGVVVTHGVEVVCEVLNLTIKQTMQS